MTIGVGLLVIIAVAAVAWFLVGRGPAESKELENQARVNEASMEGYQGPPNALSGPPPIPPPSSMPQGEGMAPPVAEEEGMEA
jgi:hypothetical protein